MTLKSFAAVYALHGLFLYFGVKSLPMTQVGVLALALSVISFSGIRMLKLR